MIWADPFLCISHLPSVIKDKDESIGLLKDEVTADEKLVEKLLVGVIGVSILMSEWKRYNILKCHYMNIM